MITSTTSTTVVSSMDTTRSSRRHRSSQMEPEFSNTSIMNAMEKFVSSVQEMNETILVPCRLMDLKVGDSADSEETKSTVPISMLHADLYSLYTMVNAVKNELLWGQSNQTEEVHLYTNGTTYIPSGATSLPPSQSTPNCINYASLPPVVKTHSRNNSASSNIKTDSNKPGHQRRPSTGSLISTHSLASMSVSDTDSEAGIEIDSGIEDTSLPDPTLHIARDFQTHLYGLYKSLQQMSSAADYLTHRYQHDVGGNV